jgi:hypothetical protein
MAIETLEAKFEDRKPNPQTLELKTNPKDVKNGENIIPLAASNNQSGTAAAASAQVRALPDKAKEEEVKEADKGKGDKNPLLAFIEKVLSVFNGITQEEKSHIIADASVTKGASIQAVEASAARVAPEKTIKDMPEGELAKVAQLKKDLSDNGIKMQQEAPTHLAYNGGKAPQQPSVGANLA